MYHLFLPYLLLTGAAPAPFPPPPAPEHPPFSPFRPSVAIIVGLLTTLFSLTFLLLLYAKHCKRTESSYSSDSAIMRYGYQAGEVSRNSGVGRAVVESLPVIRFGALKGEKDGLECAVCLGRFEPVEPLRILPKCRHGFHVECVDTWLDAHSTCPLCRVRVEPEDILISVSDPDPIIKDPNSKDPNQLNMKDDQESNQEDAVQNGKRVSGRFSTGSVPVRFPRPGSSRRSVDSVGCFEIGKVRKDRVLLPEPAQQDRLAFQRRFSHRIVMGEGAGIVTERWSDLRPSDVALVRSGLKGRCWSELGGVSRVQPSRKSWVGSVTAKWLSRGPVTDNGASA